MQTGQREIIPGTLTDIWGYDGQYPGPTFRVQRNQPIVVRFINELDVEDRSRKSGPERVTDYIPRRCPVGSIHHSQSSNRNSRRIASKAIRPMTV